MNVAACQLTPAPRDVAANVTRACALIAENADADLIVFPELFVSGYDLLDAGELATALDGPALGAIRAAAGTARSAVVVGFVEPWGGGVANSAACVERDGSLAGVYRKTHLWGVEREMFVAGDALEPIALLGRRCGVMICFDVEFPEAARTLALAGAEYLVTIAANMAPFERDHELAVHARAMENGLPHVYVNRTGDEFGEHFVGCSAIADPEGANVARAGHEPEVLGGAIFPGEGRRDARSRYLGQLRPELYATARPTGCRS